MSVIAVLVSLALAGGSLGAAVVYRVYQATPDYPYRMPGEDRARVRGRRRRSAVQRSG